MPPRSAEHRCHTTVIKLYPDTRLEPARILIVDDEPAICDLLAFALRKGEYEPVTAHDRATGDGHARGWNHMRRLTLNPSP